MPVLPTFHRAGHRLLRQVSLKVKPRPDFARDGSEEGRIPELLPVPECLRQRRFIPESQGRPAVTR